MNRQLFLLAQQYVYCYGVIEALLNMNGIESERLKIFRLTQNRMRMLEEEMEQCIVENDLENGMDKE
jgi:hypothetical protein